MLNRWLAFGIGGLLFFASLLWIFLRPSILPVVAAILGLSIALLGRPQKTIPRKFLALIYGSWFIFLAITLYMIVAKYEMVFDATPSKNHTLQPQTVTVLKNLEKPIHLVSFLEPQSPAEIHFTNLIDRFQAQTDQITLEKVNPVTNPERATAFQDLLPQGSIFLQIDGQTTPLPFSDLSEQALLKTIVQVTSDSHSVCFVYGHGEADIKDVYTTYDAGLIVSNLEMQNYKVQQIIIQNAPVPKECEIVVIANPQKDYSAVECQHLDQHLEDGNHLMVLLTPKNTPTLTKHLAKYGFLIDENKIVERSTQLQTQRGYLLDSNLFIHHPIMETLSKYPIELPTLHTVEITPLEFATAQHLARTTSQAEKQTQLEHDTGPFPVIATAQLQFPNSDKKPQIVVVGSGDLASNLFVANTPGNLYFFLNTISWMAQEEGQLHARTSLRSNIKLTRYQTFMIWLLSVGLVPGMLLFCGVYFRRSQS